MCFGRKTDQNRSFTNVRLELYELTLFLFICHRLFRCVSITLVPVFCRPRLFHSGHVSLHDVAVNNDWSWVVCSHEASSFLLYTAWRYPGLVDVLGGHLLQNWKIFSVQIRFKKSESTFTLNSFRDDVFHYHQIIVSIRPSVLASIGKWLFYKLNCFH